MTDFGVYHVTTQTYYKCKCHFIALSVIACLVGLCLVIGILGYLLKDSYEEKNGADSLQGVKKEHGLYIEQGAIEINNRFVSGGENIDLTTIIANIEFSKSVERKTNNVDATKTNLRYIVLSTKNVPDIEEPPITLNDQTLDSSYNKSETQNDKSATDLDTIITEISKDGVSEYETTIQLKRSLGTTNNLVGKFTLVPNMGDEETIKSSERPHVEHIIIPNLNTTTESLIHQECPKPIDVCSSVTCMRSASHMLALMDHSIDPCEDFHTYSCGGMSVNGLKTKNPHDDILAMIPDFDKLNSSLVHNRIIQDFYKSCLKYKNGDGLVEVAKYLYNLCLDSNTLNRPNDLADLIANILMIHPHKSSSRLMPLFDIAIDIGPDKTFVPSLTIPMFDSILGNSDDGDMYENHCLKSFSKKSIMNEESVSKLYGNYRNCIHNQSLYVQNLEKAIELLQIFDHLPAFERTQEIKKTLAFIEWNVFDMLGSVSAYDRLKGRNKLNKTQLFNEADLVTIEELTLKVPQINWKRLFQKLTGKTNVEKVMLQFPEHLENIFKYYKKYSFDDVKTSILAMIAHDLYVDFIKPQTTCNREKYCKKLSTKLMPDISSIIYLSNFNLDDFDNIQKFTDEMFNLIVHKLTTSIGLETWLSGQDKSEILSKLSKIKLIDKPIEIFLSQENFTEYFTNRNKQI